MQLIRGIHNLKNYQLDFSKGCVLTIGNFDGVHLGHLQVLTQLKKNADALDLPSVVMLFEPLPIEFFCPAKAPVRLMNLREKVDSFVASGLVDVMLVCKFDASFAKQSAKEFVQDLLVKKLQVKKLIIGDDFRFAKNREGDFKFLQEEGKQIKMEVEKQTTFMIENERVSSTRIRQVLSKYDLTEAENLLGSPFEFKGRVMHGKKLGRQLGFRTLNLNPKRNLMPVEGVYSVYVTGLAEHKVAGVANIGIRPTVDGLRPSIEVHLFNWEKEVYGAHVGVQLHQFIRPEQKFNGLDELKKQIQLDVKTAKNQLEIDQP
jgi:riboflavin kinase/FMN adenylyltransferase